MTNAYDEWKRAHGWQPQPEPRLEIGQRVKLLETLEGWRKDEPDVNEGSVGIVVQYRYEIFEYLIRFENGRECWLDWCVNDDIPIIEPVGLSPSELAAQEAERQRLAGIRQMTLFGDGGAS